MKKRSISSLLKRAATGLLTLSVVLAGAYVWPSAADQVKAETNACYTEEIAIDTYVSGTERTVPKPTDSTHKDWVFAGWYTDSTCRTALGADVKTGTFRAKFVPEEVLSAKCQIKTETSSTNPSDKLRIVSTVDSLSYQEVGFDLAINNKQRNYNTKTVYTSIKAAQDSVAFNYSPQDFNGYSRFFITCTIVNIPREAISTGILITPYWITMDGTKVNGVSRYARVDDTYNEIYNVPVRLYTNQDVAAGYLEVGYDKTKFMYAGYDAGTVFEEMEAADVMTGVVRLVGNVEDINRDVVADGMYVNLRFKKVENASLEAAETFTVSGEQFSDSNEKFVSFDVSDVVYKNITPKQ